MSDFGFESPNGSGAAGAPTTRSIATTAPLAGGGDLSADRTLTIAAASSSAAGSMSGADKTKVDAIATTAQSLSGAGAVDLTHNTTLLTATGLLQAITLADGSVGQRKRIYARTGHSAGVNTQVLTPATFASGSTITFAIVGQWIELEWQSGGWLVIGFGGGTNGAGPTVA